MLKPLCAAAIAIATLSSSANAAEVLPKAGDDILTDPAHLAMIVRSNQLVMRSRGEDIEAECHCGPRLERLSDIPKHVRDALIAMEDRRFRIHNGVDSFGILRAIVRKVSEGGRMQGGSTLTQQLCKNTVLSSETTLVRKGLEAACALSLERAMSKDEILLAYFNGVDFGSTGGRPIVGIEQAARTILGKPAANLSLLEGAMLVGMLKSPANYHPVKKPKASRERAVVVLGAMVKEGYITEAQMKRAASAKVRVGDQGPVQFETRYFTDWVRRDLVRSGVKIAPGMRVALTYEAWTQSRAEAAFQSALKARGLRNATAARFMTMKLDGRVVAMMGGQAYRIDQSDGVDGDLRQPASTFKPFVYAAALENGMTANSRILDGAKPGERWSPAMLKRHYGMITLRDALAKSANIATVRLAEDVGSGKIVALARRLGISSNLRDDASLPLGASEVSLLQLTGAYAAFANGGVSVKPYGYLAVTDDSGRIVTWQGDHRRRALTSEVAGTMRAMLQAVVAKGTGRRASAVEGAGGKTGTSDNNRDAWFIGFTEGQVTGVWAGTRPGQSSGLPVSGEDMAGVWARIVQAFRKG
jgi:penicillin-binding protein 1A